MPFLVLQFFITEEQSRLRSSAELGGNGGGTHEEYIWIFFKYFFYPLASEFLRWFKFLFAVIALYQQQTSDK